MKIIALSRKPNRRSEQGVALVLVLLFLVILSSVILAFFNTATSEVTTSTAYTSGVSTKMLSDVVTNIVEAQIEEGTQGKDPQTGSPLAWASQPGMIRTYDSQGAAKNLYKLYSSDNMEAQPSDLTQGDSKDLLNLPGSWNTAQYSDIYTDLNEPVLSIGLQAANSASGDTNPADSLVYPIVDPSAAGSVGGTELNKSGNGQVDGFAIVKPPGFSGGTPSPSNNPAPMPVRWLYLLQDGTLSPGVLGGGAGGSSDVSVANATASNPVIGRIAFWTDDESSKVNINTASEGTYWDVPRVYSRGLRPAVGIIHHYSWVLDLPARTA